MMNKKTDKMVAMEDFRNYGVHIVRETEHTIVVKVNNICYTYYFDDEGKRVFK